MAVEMVHAFVHDINEAHGEDCVLCHVYFADDADIHQDHAFTVEPLCHQSCETETGFLSEEAASPYLSRAPPVTPHA